MYTVGSSGSGKSRFARHLIHQDIEANRGATVVDAQDLAREILAYIAEAALGSGKTDDRWIEELGDKLVIIEPADQRFGVPGINLLEVGDGQVRYQIVDGLIETIRELWPDTFGPRLEDVCRNALLLLAELGLTALEIVPLLSDAEFRARLVARSQNPEVRMYFEQHLGGLRASEVKVWLESSRNKWNAFLANPFVRPILGQARSTINLRDVVDKGQWLIVNISRDKLRESRRLIGALIVMLLHHAVISRDRLPPERRIFHTIYCDEFQEYFTPTFLHILEGSRKYGLALALFHQNLTQPPFDDKPAVVDTILANTHTQVAFSVARRDAQRLAGEFFLPSGTEPKFQRHVLGIPVERPVFWSMPEEREYAAVELMTQRTAEAYVKFKGLGDDEPYAMRVPEVPDVVIDQEKIDILRRHVARRYYRPLDAVKREIDERWAAIRGGMDAFRPIGRDCRR
jgi:hypothetical protein